MSSFAEYTNKRKKKQQENTSFSQYTKSVLGDAYEGDIAPVKKTTVMDEIAPTGGGTDSLLDSQSEERTWFNKGVVKDNGILKTILGSGVDISENLSTGIIGMGEKFADLLAYVAPAVSASQNSQNSLNYQFDIEDYRAKQKESADFIAKDWYDEEKIAKAIISDNARKIGIDAEKQSIFGEKSDALAQSAGQLGATVALQAVGVPWFMTTGVTSFGSEAENALNQGATYEEAGLSAAITAGAEIISEKIASGINFGSKTLMGELVDDKMARIIAENFSNKAARTLVKLGVDASEEGFEEIFSGIMSAIGQKLTYADEKELNELFSSEEAFESFIGGFVLGGGSSSINAVQTMAAGRDYVTGLTNSEQSILDTFSEERINERTKQQAAENEINKAIAEREVAQGGVLTDKNKESLRESIVAKIDSGEIDISSTKLNKKTISQIRQEVENDLTEGKLELSKIEDILTSEKAEQIKGLEKSLESIKDQAEQAKIEAKINELKVSRATDLKGMLQTNKFLKKAVYEEQMAHQTYSYDESTVIDEHEKRTRESAVRLGVNNTTSTRKFVDNVAKLAKDSGKDYVLTNNQELLEQGDLVEKTEKDLTEEDKALIKSLEAQLQKATTEPEKKRIQNKILAVKYWDVGGLVRVNTDGVETVVLNVDSEQAMYEVVGHETRHTLENESEDLNKDFNKLLFDYAEAKGDLETFRKETERLYNTTDEDVITRELSARLTGHYLFNDSNFLENLINDSANTKTKKIVQKIKNLIDDLVIRFKGSDQEKQLREIQKKFKELYNQKSGAKATEGTSHSLANNGKGDYNNYKTHNLFTQVTRKFHDTKRNEFFVNDFENYYKVRTEEYGSYEILDVIKISGNEERIMQLEKELSNETNTNGKSTNRNNEVFRYIEGHNHWNNAETTGQSWTEFIDEVLKKYESEGTDGHGSYEQGLGNSRGNRYSLSDKASSKDGVFFDAQKDGVMYSVSEDSNVLEDVKKAEEYFGTTYKIKEAGYLLTDGKLLDFSGKHEGAPGGYRTVDHRDIIDAFDGDYGDGSHSGGMIQFMQAGNIRLAPENGGINLAVKPNKAQLAALDRYITNFRGEVTLDIDDANGNTVVSMEYPPRTYSKRIINDINEYFDNGVIPEQPSALGQFRYSLSEGAKGSQLSEKQIEYFKDSKIRDDNGNLKVMYHGSPAQFTVFDKKKAKSSGYYGRGFYFSESESHAGQYGSKYEVYLNIKNPMQEGTNDITKEQLRKFVNAVAENEDYGIENYGYDATVDSVTNSVYGKDDFAMIMDINATSIGDMVEAIQLFNEINGTNYDGIVVPTETVAFYPEQIKSIANKNPTDNPDINLSLSDASAPIGSRLKDLRVKTEEQDIALETAPVQEPTNQLRDTTEMIEDVAPVANTVPAEDIAPVQPAEEKEQQTNEKVAKILHEEPVVEREESGFASTVMENLVDKGYVFEKLSKKTKNRELEAKWNYIRYAEGMAQDFLGNGTDGVKALVDIIEDVEHSGLEYSLEEYVYHLHNIDRMSLSERFEGMEDKAVFGDSVTADVSRAKVTELEAKHPKLKKYANELYSINNYLRGMLVDGGVISQETADLWAEMYPHFMPIRRAGDHGLNINVPLDTRRTGVNAPVKRATGGNSDILPLFDTIAQRALQTYKAVAKNRFGVELKNTLGTVIEADTADVDGIIEGVEKQDDLLKEGKNGRKPTFTVFEDGERVTFEITEEMYDALKPTNKHLAKTYKIPNAISSAHRGILTQYNPSFLARNAIKDSQDVLINSQHPVKTYANFPKAINEMRINGKWYKEYLKNGGERNTYFDKQTNTFVEDSSGLSRVLGMPLRAINRANDYVERLPRLAEYIASREEGKSIEVSMLDAARVTTNFAAGGDVTKFLNRNGATFLNASVQGAMQQVRNIQEARMNGAKGWVQLATKYAIAGLPAVLLNGLLWDDDEEYEELSDYVKQNYYIVAKYGDGKFVRIPKGRTLAVIQNAFEQTMNALTGDDEVDLASFVELAISNLAPNNPVENNIISPIIQVANNETWYGEDLVPTRLQDLPDEEQYDESIDTFSKWLGGKIGQSPYKINYLLDQYSGGIGDSILPMLTPEAETADDTLASKMLAPIRDAFVTDSVLNNQNVSDFYDLSDELTKNANKSAATDEDVLSNKYFNSVKTQIGKLYAEKREVQNSDISDSEKYYLVRDIQKKINALAENALNEYSSVNIDGEYSSVGDIQYRKTDSGWTKITDNQLEKQNEITSSFGVAPAEYWANKEEYDYAYESPGKYSIAKAVGGFTEYKKLSKALNDIKADKDSAGKSISGSRKNKVLDYINSLDVDYGTRIILYKSEYPSDATYNNDILEYLNNRQDITASDMKAILTELGFTVDADGTVRW